MKKVLTLLFILLFSVVSVFAFSNYANLLNTYVMPDFALGTFPSGVTYELGISGVELIPKQSTKLVARFNTGLVVRSLTQHPVDGSLIANTDNLNLKYYAFVSEGDAFFSQSFYRSPKYNNDYLTVSMGLKMRWEQAFRIFSLKPDTHLESVFDNPEYFPENTVYYGAPELNGNGSLVTNSLNFGVHLSDYHSTSSYSEGFKFDVEMSLAPWFLANDLPFFDTFSDYLKFNMNGQYAYHLIDGEKFLGIDATIKNVLKYQYLSGSAIPKHAQTISFNGLGFAFYSQIIMNECTFEFVRPKIFMDTNSIGLYIKWYEGIGFGTINNRVSKELGFDHFGSVGVELKGTIFNILHFYLSCDYIYDNVNSASNGFKFGYGGYISYSM